MTESLEGEIRILRSLFWSDRDPDGRGFAQLADAYRRDGDPKQAFELLGDGLDRQPDFSPGHVVATRLYLEQGLFSEAEISARRALDLDLVQAAPVSYSRTSA
ncbi:MAG TPA: tetratricopeptide repeat protein [Gemmatimonadetes bacterium]|nr:tetratricopeptide repeat protein [Gemmatimonadota bacterium]